jgi:transcriptional regulator with XRE-family HTH domain
VARKAIGRRQAPATRPTRPTPRKDGTAQRRLPVPTDALPGSPRKVQVLAERQARGEQLHHPDDARDDGRVLLWQRQRNGADVPIGVVEEGQPDELPSGNNLGSRIRALRERAGLTAKQLAARAGLTTATASRVEGGKRTPTLSVIIAIANALCVSLDFLVGRTPPPALTASEPAPMSATNQKPPRQKPRWRGTVPAADGQPARTFEVRAWTSCEARSELKRELGLKARQRLPVGARVERLDG